MSNVTKNIPDWKELYNNESLDDRIKEEKNVYNMHVLCVHKAIENIEKAKSLIANFSIKDIKSEEDFKKLYELNWEVYNLLEECGDIS